MREKVAMMLIDRKIKVREGRSNEASMVDNTIWYNAKEAAKDEYGFVRNLRERHYYAAEGLNLKLITLLHEVGHIKTRDYTFESDNDNMNRTLCALTPKEVAMENIELQDLYYALPLEWEATEWAIDWLNRNRLKAKILNKIL